MWLRHLVFQRRSLLGRPARPRVLSQAPAVEELESRIVPTLLGQNLFPANNPWNQVIANAPVASNSNTIINDIITNQGSNAGIHPDFGQDTQSANPLFGIPYNVVHGNSTPKVHVVIDNYPSESDLENAPIVSSVVIEGDFQNGPNFGLANRGDSHLIVWDEDNNIVYEFGQASRPDENSDGQWHAGDEAVWNLNTNAFRSIGFTSTDAAGLSILAGLVRPDEGLPASQGGQGAIDHAIRMTLENTDNQFIYPASHRVTVSSSHPIPVPMGARFRLKASVNISGLDPESQIIAQAMKTYGLIVADIGSNFYFTGASYSVDANNNFASTWNDNDIQSSTVGLKSLTFSDFELVSLTPSVSSISSSSAAAGVLVTITGQNFSGAAGHLQVLFGSTPASSVNVLSDTQVQAVVPAGTGTVNVTVQSGINIGTDSQDATSPIFGYGTSTTFASFTYLASGVTVSPAALPAWTVNEAGYNSSLTGGGGTAPYSFAVTSGTLPTGLSLSSSGALTGTPTAIGTFSFTVTATDKNNLTGTQSYLVTINPALSLAATSLGYWTVNEANYDQVVMVNGGTGSDTFSITSGSLPPGLSLNGANGSITGTPTTIGTFNFTIKATDSAGASVSKALTIVINPVISISTTSLASWTVNLVGYNQTLATSGGGAPDFFSVLTGSLPTGLSLNYVTGAITGKPTALGTFNFTVQATDNTGSTTTKALSILISAAGTITITTSSLAPWTVNSPSYSQTLTATGGTGALTFSISAGSLPTGLNLTPSTGAITGTPTVAGTFNFTVTATDTLNATGNKALSIVINPALSITTTSLASWTMNQPSYSQTVATTGGTGPITYALTSGSLPTGLGLNTSTGAITGTPTVLGTSSFTVQATDSTGATTSKSLSIAIVIFQVTSFTPTSSGFTITFNEAAAPGQINLYDAFNTYGVSDVSLIGAVNGPVEGSLQFNATYTSITFVETNFGGRPEAATLAPDTYTVTLRSAATGFEDVSGALLDGDNNGVPGGNYVNTFTVNPSSAVVVTVPDFARGPGQAVNLPATGANGIPINIGNASGVTSVSFTLNYDPTLLTITGGGTTLSGATLNVNVTTPGTAQVTFSSPTALSAGDVTIGHLTASVPQTAPYQRKDVLHFSSVMVNGGALTSAGGDALQVVAYPGDASGNEANDAFDASLITRVALALDTGFTAFKDTDPLIIGDINGNNRLDSADASLLLRAAVGISVPQIPAIPTGFTIVSGGPDPSVSLPSQLTFAPDGALVVPVNIDDPAPTGSTGMVQASLALTYDPHVLSVSTNDIRLGSLPVSGAGWQLSSVIDPVSGQIGITLFSMTPLILPTGGSLVTIEFSVQHGSVLGSTSVQLVSAVDPSGGPVFHTAVADSQGAYTLTVASDTSTILVPQGAVPPETSLAMAPISVAAGRTAVSGTLAVSAEGSEQPTIESASDGTSVPSPLQPGVVIELATEGDDVPLVAAAYTRAIPLTSAPNIPLAALDHFFEAVTTADRRCGDIQADCFNPSGSGPFDALFRGPNDFALRWLSNQTDASITDCLLPTWAVGTNRLCMAAKRDAFLPALTDPSAFTIPEDSSDAQDEVDTPPTE